MIDGVVNFLKIIVRSVLVREVGSVVFGVLINRVIVKLSFFKNKKKKRFTKRGGKLLRSNKRMIVF